MFSVVLVIHLIITVSLVGIILLQRSDAGGLGSMSGGGNMGAMAPRAQADGITKLTGYLAAAFIITSLTLVILTTQGAGTNSLVDQLAQPTPATEPSQPTATPGNTPAAPNQSLAPDANAPAPAVPLSK